MNGIWNSVDSFHRILVSWLLFPLKAKIEFLIKCCFENICANRYAPIQKRNGKKKRNSSLYYRRNRSLPILLFISFGDLNRFGFCRKNKKKLIEQNHLNRKHKMRSEFLRFHCFEHFFLDLSQTDTLFKSYILSRSVAKCDVNKMKRQRNKKRYKKKQH